MELHEYIRQRPKVELHVHLEGSIRPETLLKLAQRHGTPLPADSVEGLQEWYRFRDFRHFVDVYVTLCSCIREPDDIELITREFLQGQAAQNIRYTEATYTCWTMLKQSGISLDAQLAAINRARAWSEAELDVRMGLVIDIVREESVEDGLSIAHWAIENHSNGVAALGLSGFESDTEPKKHVLAFSAARHEGLPITCHAGETEGPWSIWGCLEDLGADRIGHGVRCLEDPDLVERLRERRIPLEVCPSSNVCLGVSKSIAEHPIKRMIELGLNVSVNSDDPPMFGTTLTDEFIRCADAFGWDEATIDGLTLAAARAAFVTEPERSSLLAELGEKVESAT